MKCLSFILISQKPKSFELDPKINLKDGLSKTIKYYKKNEKLLKKCAS